MSKSTLALVGALSAAGGAALTAATMVSLRSSSDNKQPPAPARVTSTTTTTTTTSTSRPPASLSPHASTLAQLPATPSSSSPPSSSDLVNPGGLFEYGFPGPVSDLAVRSALISSFDRRTRNPHWVVEHLTPESLARRDGDRRRSSFAEDEAVPARFRALLADYRRSGYDRGHQVPAADARFSQRAVDETFFLTNMCPQVGDGFNRDYWAHLEDFCRRLTARYPSVRVVTGPLYLPRRDGRDGKWYVRYEVIGSPPNVAVPTHFYKVIFAEDGREGGDVAIGAFVLPNAPIPNDKPITDFEVPVEAVERASGLEFATKLPPARKKRLCSDTTCALVIRDYGERQRSPTPEGQKR